MDIALPRLKVQPVGQLKGRGSAPVVSTLLHVVLQQLSMDGGDIPRLFLLRTMPRGHVNWVSGLEPGFVLPQVGVFVGGGQMDAEQASSAIKVPVVHAAAVATCEHLPA